MKVFKLFLFLVALSVSTALAQDNVFLDRSYWKENPTIEKVEQDITAGNDITALTRSMFDPVCYAIMEKTDNATIKHLLSKKGNAVDKLTHDGRTYIFWAAYRNNLGIMQHLVDKGAKANIEDSHGYSVLNFAAVTGQTNPELYDFLLDHKADLQAKNHDGANALLLVAPYAKDYDIVQYFVDKGLSLASEDNSGNGLFLYAVRGGNIALLKELVSKAVPYDRVNKTGGNAFLLASQGTRGSQNSLETYAYLEGLGLEPNITDALGRNPLHAIAARNEDLTILNYFLEKGVDVNQQDEDGATPYLNAAERNSVDVVRLLTQRIQDINAKDKAGRSALALAVRRNKPEVVQFLLDQGADIHTLDKKGNTLAFYLIPTFTAKKPEAFETKLRLLQDKGLDLTQVQHDGNTLLHLAAQENQLALLKRLLSFGIDINLKNRDGNTALHLAAMSAKNDKMLKYLVEKGADTSLKTDFEESVYDLVSENEELQGQLANLEFLK